MRGQRFSDWASRVSPSGEGSFSLTIGERAKEVRLISWEAGLLSFEVDGRVVSAAVEVGDGRVEVTLEGLRKTFPLESSRETHGETPDAGGLGLGLVRAELPGKVLEVAVSEGDSVGPGQVLMRIEAMKMEHALRAGVSARVVRVWVEAGVQIAAGEVLLELGEAAG